MPTKNQDESHYGYIPTRSTAIIFIVLFSLSTIVHAGQAFKYRMWWIFPTICLCGVIEILGWSGRLWSSFNPVLSTPFQIEITATIVGPTPLLAANFVILGKIIKVLGPAFSRLTPKWYTILFCSFDVISLFVQGGGGGIAASANNPKGTKTGGDIMLGGIVFQLMVIVIYTICAIEYFVRYTRNAPIPGRSNSREQNGAESTTEVRGKLTRNMKIILYALGFNTLCLFIRAVYRVIELADGWKGRIFTTQVYFNVLDGAMVILAIYTSNIIHPGKYLAPERKNFKSLSATASSIDMKVIEKSQV